MQKKSIQSFIIILSVAVMLSASVVISSAAGGSYMRGDADGDSQVTVYDATAVQRKLAGMNVSPFAERAADIDGNGLDITDATKIQRYAAHMSDPYHIGEFVDPTQPTTDEYELPLM